MTLVKAINLANKIAKEKDHKAIVIKNITKDNAKIAKIEAGYTSLIFRHSTCNPNDDFGVYHNGIAYTLG